MPAAPVKAIIPDGWAVAEADVVALAVAVTTNKGVGLLASADATAGVLVEAETDMVFPIPEPCTLQT